MLKADTFNVDRYLPPKSAEANSATQVRQAEVASTEADCHGRRWQHAAAGQADQRRLEHRRACCQWNA